MSSHATPKRARYANGERRRAELVDTAMQVFADQGFQRMSIRQLAEAMGTSHSLLIHHFGSKAGLIEAVLTRREEIERPWRDEIAAEIGTLDTAVEVMRHNATIPGLIQLDVTIMSEAINPDHPAHDYVVRLNKDFLQTLRVGLEDEARAGRLRDGLDLDLVAEQIFSLVHGLQLAWVHDSSVDMAAVMKAYTDLLRAPGKG